MSEKLLHFLNDNPLTKELLEHAELCPDDIRMYGHLPYLVDEVVGDGWSLVGDAAGFLDPFYSPGLDQMAFSVSAAIDLIRKSKMKGLLRGPAAPARDLGSRSARPFGYPRNPPPLADALRAAMCH